MERAERTKTALYMRGTDPVHHLRRRQGERGGGKRVRLIDPGQPRRGDCQRHRVRCPRCQSCGKPSIRAQGVAQRRPPATATRRVHVKRIGHGVVMISDLARALGSAFLAIKTAELTPCRQVLNVLRGWPRIVCCVSVSVRAGLSLKSESIANDVSKTFDPAKFGATGPLFHRLGIRLLTSPEWLSRGE